MEGDSGFQVIRQQGEERGGVGWGGGVEKVRQEARDWGLLQETCCV